MLTFEQIKELVELVSARGLQGIELERSGFRLKIDGKQSAPVAAPVAVAPATLAAVPPAVATPLVASVAAPVAAPRAEALPEAPPEEDLYTIPSPIVGTFYRSPSP
ncbi:MAG: acetyl-CoA carboxylase biotin carboxyl carrier protein, partial [Acidobacteria bacterium]|nr:acetyl-CoA carboxylase biotin carboxyl carrier protein [Acidobacteriota bacterium]